jgi:subtilisin family serine protease
MWALGFSGQGIVIGLADTGFVWDHPVLRRQYRGWDGSAVSHDYNWHDAVHDANDVFHTPRILSCGSNAPAPCDDDGHGTAMASLAVGDDGEGNRVGVAPGSRFIGCRNMDQGTGTPARYLECIEWLFAPTDSKGAHPRVDLGADIISNSWLCAFSEGCTDPEILRGAVENVRAAGVPFLAAAGNDLFGCGHIFFPPAIYDASITVGATDMDDLYATFSSTGPVTVDGSWRLKPDLSAPGQDVRVAWLDSYKVVSGTSVATPEVAGGIALLWSALPVLAGDVDGTETALEKGAVPLTSPIVEEAYSGDDLQKYCGGYSGLVVPNILFGWGRLDVETAYVKYLRSLDGAPRRNGPVVPAPPESPALVVPPRPRR